MKIRANLEYNRIQHTTPAACDTGDHHFWLSVLISVIISLTERALLFPLWWSLALRVLGCGYGEIGCCGLGEEYVNRSGLRGERITLRARRVLTAILVLMLGLMLVGGLVGIIKSQL